jgi:hypothetical protein
MTNGTRRGWGVSVTPRPLFIPGKDPVPIVQEAGWVRGQGWTGTENLTPTRIRSPDRLARSQSLYRLRYPLHNSQKVNYKNCTVHFRTRKNVKSYLCGICINSEILRKIDKTVSILWVRITGEAVVTWMLKNSSKKTSEKCWTVCSVHSQ